MATALYHPECGYYRRGKDPFGPAGDFYTAEQLQPVFGILIAARIRALWEEMAKPRDFTVVELGAGRGAMAEYLREFRYIPVEITSGSLPDEICGVVFSNEFFDALPVHRVVWKSGVPRVSRVGWNGNRFVWVEGEPAHGELERYVRRYCSEPEEGLIFEANLEALTWLERIAQTLRSGFALTIDYGYTTREARRFPAGTLMSYRRHNAEPDVLAEPGERDITAHVLFTALQDRGSELGLETVRFETLAQTILAAGEPDQFAGALRASNPQEELKHRGQLKALLYGMGESFYSLLQKKPAGVEQ